jgi:hypothetical protein
MSHHLGGFFYPISGFPADQDGEIQATCHYSMVSSSAR